MTTEAERLAACRAAFRKWVEESGADFSLETERDDTEPDGYCYTDSHANDAFDGFQAAHDLYAREIEMLRAFLGTMPGGVGQYEDWKSKHLEAAEKAATPIPPDTPSGE